MHVAVVGGSGFVGGHVADKLLDAGHKVRIVDWEEPPWHTHEYFVRADIRDVGEVQDAVRGAEVVIHLAAVSNTTLAATDPAGCTELNCTGTANVLEAAVRVGVGRVIVAGSTLTSAYQFTEDDLRLPYSTRWIDEIDPYSINEVTHPYMASKIYTEMITRSYAVHKDLEYTIFRFGIQYGPRMTPGVVVHNFIAAALNGNPIEVHGDGEQWRQYVYVEDVADAHVLALEKLYESGNNTFNLVGSDKVRIIDIAREVAKETGADIKHVEARPNDTSMKMCSGTHVENLLGWKAKTSLEDGIRKTIQWYRDNRWAWNGVGGVDSRGNPALGNLGGTSGNSW